MLNMNTCKMSIASVLASLSILPSALAGFSASSQSNVAVYWGQGSGQKSLASYCSNTPVNIIPIAFEVSLLNPATGMNTGNIDSSNVGPDITTCQQAGKTILLSIGGATFTENGLTTSDIAVSAAQKVWSLFGPDNGSTSSRPFGSAVVDGFDLDLETTGLDNIAVFVQELRTLMDADNSKKWMLTAAPQCPYPDAADKDFLQGEVAMDAVFVQFYNNPECSVTNFKNGEPGGFNLDTWHTWATTTSKNPDVKVFIGIPGAQAAAGSGYIDSASLAPIIAYAKTFSSFGGIMSWDMVEIVGNEGYLDSVQSALGGAVSSVLSGLTATATTVATAYGSSAASTPVSVPTTTSQRATSAPQTTTSTTLATSIVSTVSTLVTQTRTTNSKPGGIFATVATSAAASSTTIVTSISTPVSIATVVSSLPAASATTNTSASSPSSTSTSTSSGGQTPGSPCTVDGTWICITGGTSFQQCGSGTWSAVMQLADGTSCTAGQGQSIDIVATKERRKRERVGRHVHRHVRSS